MHIRDFNGKPYFEGMEVIATCGVMSLTFVFLLFSATMVLQKFDLSNPLIWINQLFSGMVVKLFIVMLVAVLPYLYYKYNYRYRRIIEYYDSFELPVNPYLAVVLFWALCLLPGLICVLF